MIEFASFVKELGLPTAGLIYMAYLLLSESKSHAAVLIKIKDEADKRFISMRKESDEAFIRMYDEQRDLTRVLIDVVKENSRVIASLVQLVQARD